MEANDITLQALINAPKQYIIPVFQRYYSWHQEDWDTLWSDIEVLTETGNQTRTHFMGSLVFFPLPPAFNKNPTYQVIDGQQRLVTFSLILSVLRFLANQHDQKMLEAEIEENFLVHRFKKGEERFRIYPRQRDREEYLEAVMKPNIDIDGNIGDAFRFFTDKLTDFIEAAPAQKLQELLDLLKARLEFVYIQLDGENPYEIFKSLNSKGVPLSEADLIRNFVFMHVKPEMQDEFDDQLWRPLEAHFEYKSGDDEGQLDAKLATRFFRDYLMKSGKYVPTNAVFETFEAQAGDAFDPFELAAALHQDARFYDIIRGQKAHPDPTVDASLSKLRKLESSTTYPLLMALLQKAKDGAVTDEQLNKAIELTSGFILRRYASYESSRPYGRWFVSACDELSDKPVENLNRFLFEKGYPNDRQFKTAFSTFPWYIRSYTAVVLEALERASEHKEPADLSKASIEHIMPQTLTDTWRKELGDNAAEIHEEWLHTIGNLTLSAYNPELFNHAFRVKSQEYARSNITMNRDLLQYETWGEGEIKNRAATLAAVATAIWIGPDKVAPRPKASGPSRSAKRNENGLTPTRQLQLDFWTAYMQYLEAQGSQIKTRKPYPENYATFAIGRWEFGLGHSIHIADKRTNVYLSMEGPDTKRHYRYLLENKDVIEAELDTSLDWYEFPKKKTSFIYLSTYEFDTANRDLWPRQHAWMHRWLEAFYNCFRPRTLAMRDHK